MKKIILVCSLIISQLGLTFAQNVTTPEEQESIKTVVSDESTYFYNRNAEKWANCYRQTASTYWACIEKDGTLQKEGWDAIGPFVTGYIKDNPKPIKCSFKRENYNFRKVNPTYIWLTFDQTRTTGKTKDFSKETRIMELIKGEWKIVNMTGFWMPLEEKTKEVSKAKPDTGKISKPTKEAPAKGKEVKKEETGKVKKAKE
jgi:hypothetical protein